MNKFIVGIRAKDTGYLRGLMVVDDVREFVRDFRASVNGKECAYTMFSDKYEIVAWKMEVPLSAECIDLLGKDAK